MTIYEIICLPIFMISSKFVEILFGRIPGAIITYVTRVLEKMVKEFWQNTFVPCMYKFESMKASCAS